MTITPARLFGIATIVTFLVVMGWIAIRFGSSGGDAPEGAAAGGGTAAPATPTPKIKATLFYVNDDGVHLKPAEREVAFGESTVEQAKRLVEAQLEAPPTGWTSAIPAGTTLRSIFVTEPGEAFVDVSREISAAHPGGSLNEILTVYTIVQALTANLPAITTVQILVDGHEVETLAGHVDLRRPLPANPRWVATETEPAKGSP
jgi:spore germination protein GerM